VSSDFSFVMASKSPGQLLCCEHNNIAEACPNCDISIASWPTKRLSFACVHNKCYVVCKSCANLPVFSSNVAINLPTPVTKLKLFLPPWIWIYPPPKKFISH